MEGTRRTGRAKKAVIVGAGIAGLAAAQSLREASPLTEITLISREPHLPYYRLNLTRYLNGEIDRDDLPIHPQSWYDEHNIRLLLGAEALTLELPDRNVACSGGETLPYHKLLLTTGAQPFVPPITGADRDGVTTFRTLDDADFLLKACTPGKKCVVIGGGVLGLETAAALVRRGAEVTLLEGHGWLMPRQLNEAAGELLAEHAAELGITLRKNAQTHEILGDRQARAVQLADGDELDAELVVIASGIRANTSLARTAGFEVHRGIAVDNSLATSHPDVYAAGDVAELHGVGYGLWNPAQLQGNIAGMNMAGLGAEFGGIPQATTLKVVGLDVFSVGEFSPPDAGYNAVSQRIDGRYYQFVFRDGRLAGAILAGDTRAAADVQKAVEENADFSGLLARNPTAGDVAEVFH